MSAAVTRVLDRLEAARGSVRQSGSSWSARCPAHDDRAPSLSISEGDDGRALIRCHAGCDTTAVLAALELCPADLFDTPANGHRPEPLVTFDYVDELGELVFQVVRKPGKQFRQRRPDGLGGWVWNVQGVRQVPYRLPELLAGIAAGDVVYVVEGEKDVDAAYAAGAVATCNAMGASKWTDDHTKYLAGAGLVVVVADRDAPGIAHAHDVAATLRSLDVDVELLCALEGKDLSDHLAAGHSIEDLRPLDDDVDVVPAASAPAEVLDGELPDEFWAARPMLEHIRQAAWNRQRSAAALLHVILARVAASLLHTIELPAVVGSTATLSYFALLLARSGVGKSSANGIATELLPITSDRVADQLPLGSGEGLVETLFEFVDEEGDDGKKRKTKRQVIFGAYVFVDEGQVLAELGGRAGSTLLSTLRSIWSGAVIGQNNASDRRRIVPAGQYIFGVVVGLQDSKAAVLLDDAAAGTPQRFAWARATDPAIPDDPPEWPGPLDWTPPTTLDLAELETRTAGFVRHQLRIAPEIAAELRAADLARARGHGGTDELDAHGGLLQLKIAALLAILDASLEVRPDDWRLAAMVKTASDAVRNGIVEQTRDEAARAERQTSERLANRAVAADTAVERRRLVDTARTIATKVHAADDDATTTVASLRRSLSQARRALFDDALAHAITEQWIVEAPEPGQGADKRAIRPGTRRPA
jgi:hypothetical protein